MQLEGINPNSGGAGIDDDEDNGIDCTICLTIMKEAVSTDCGHSYCNSCITDSRKVNKNCPICRHVIEKITPNFVLRKLIAKELKKGAQAPNLAAQKIEQQVAEQNIPPRPALPKPAPIFDSSLFDASPCNAMQIEEDEALAKRLYAEEMDLVANSQGVAVEAKPNDFMLARSYIRDWLLKKSLTENIPTNHLVTQILLKMYSLFPSLERNPIQGVDGQNPDDDISDFFDHIEDYGLLAHFYKTLEKLSITPLINGKNWKYSDLKEYRHNI